MATATASMEASQTLMQSESRVQRTYTESVQVSGSGSERQVKKTRNKSMRRHKDEGAISVSKSSEKLYKKMKAASEGENNPICEKCSRPVYAMERVKAERRAWHKDCFRCVQCNKPLTVETYQSDHTTLYCKQHFKQLFAPKAVDGEDEVDDVPKRHQMIICESNPVELPPDVVRASDKPDLGLEELSQLDVKSRFEVFEKKKSQGQDEAPQPEPRRPGPREKSTVLLSKLAKFKSKGMDVGVSDEYLNGVPIEHSSSEADDDDDDGVLRRSYKHSAVREQTAPLCDMSEMLGRFENATLDNAERRRERKQEIQSIRSRLFMGKQAKIKEMYEQSVAQSEQSVTSAEKRARDLQQLQTEAERARALKERFESGEIYNGEKASPRTSDLDDQTLFSEGIGKKSRSIFLELDASAKSAPSTEPPPNEPPRRKELPFIPKDVVRAADKTEEIRVDTSDISDRFKFFETFRPETKRKEFRMTPPRQTQQRKSPSPEVYHEPSVVRDEGGAVDTSLAAQRHTASRMISVFRQMEEDLHKNEEPQGPKPLKRFTPPPPGEQRPASSSEDEYSGSEDEDEDDSEDERRRAYLEARQRDEALKQAQQLARTKSFRGRFENNWSESEANPGAAAHGAPPAQLALDIERRADDDGDSQVETAKSLREKFENMKGQHGNVVKTFAPRVNRFV